jgi:DNA primase
MNRQVLDDLKQQVSLLEYLRAQHWQQAKPIGNGRFLGLCPLHADRQPSLLVDPNKNLFYCYGCRRGGDIVRFVELYHQVRFPQAVALLHQWRGLAPLLSHVVSFYRMQLHRHSEAVAYLFERGVRSPELIERMRIGYAPGSCLRSWLMQLGYRSSIGSSFRWKATFMAAVFRDRRLLTGFCRPPRAASTAGRKCNRNRR